ncbi:TetR family transcriptional regulator [Rhodococcus sp. 05-340-1]|jgi:AcrR family transcriptional regulator|uniref:TetR/AcrR family transcriptional regulator n=1 Tax=unclassified Rhodococcus (in: high G+C Gram-positive bacteria) TaxID=192944 RepID=UPI000B9C4EDA|nr:MULTISPECIES: TetR/AcrR family transcriptional regulator [unclassified Rhodococcus (in: high G+C Gram-positive bacteria)]OZD60439.1 TetR family transcriptional regulator [Rhodococcus sp. 05-340-2]OZD79173.1 TetR family transcriptional regulator [Rhodococcus sp. 05-340-1]
MSVRADTAASKPLRADAERNRRRIVDAARELFASHGIDITLDDVAAHAKVGVGTVYRRFSCKEELIDGVFEQRLEDMLATAQRALEAQDPWEGLVQFLTDVCEGMSADRGLGDVVLGSDEGCRGIAQVRSRIDPFFEKIVDRALASGQLRPDVAVNDFYPVLGMIGSCVEFSSAVDAANWRRYFTVLLDGLRGDGVPRSALPGRPFTSDEVDAAKTAMHRRRR